VFHMSFNRQELAEDLSRDQDTFMADLHPKLRLRLRSNAGDWCHGVLTDDSPMPYLSHQHGIISCNQRGEELRVAIKCLERLSQGTITT